MMPEAANDSLFMTASRDSRIGMRGSESNAIFRLPDPGSRDSCVIVCS